MKENDKTTKREEKQGTKPVQAEHAEEFAVAICDHQSPQ
jgi:hypothetical protein